MQTHEIELRIRYSKDKKSSTFDDWELLIDGDDDKTLPVGDLAWLLMQAYHHIMSEDE